MAALSNTGAMASLLAYAEKLGLEYVPMRAEAVEAAANDPFAYEEGTFIEDKQPHASGYYKKYASGWALVAIGPSLGGRVLSKKEWLRVPKGDGWATRDEWRRALVSDSAKSGDIVYNVAPNGVVRLAEAVEVDARGYPTSLLLRGDLIDPRDVDGVWEKAPGREEAARYLYDQGKDSFINLWTYKTQLGKRIRLLKEAKMLDHERDSRRTFDHQKALDKENSAFVARVKRAKLERLKSGA
jgi:hypothetical protein